MNEKSYKGLVAVAILGLIVGTWGMVDRLTLRALDISVRILCTVGPLGRAFTCFMWG